MRKSQKLIALSLSAILSVVGLAGCDSKKTAGDGKVSITIGSWPDKTDERGTAIYADYLAQMNEKFPDIEVKSDTTKYSDAKIFQMKAAAKSLPTMYQTHFTEIQKTITPGYAADITAQMEKFGLADAINPILLDLCKGEDGKIYALPVNAYMQGLNVNAELFKQAGLVNADGSIKYPDTYEQLAEYAKIIKEKTGQAGYTICTANNCGGWHFMNIAWSYGVKFMEQDADGKWKATFNTQEAIDALQYVKDLKWKYNALPNETVIKQADGQQIFGVGQSGMLFDGPSDAYSSKYGMKIENINMAKMPAGPAGRFAQMGGSVMMFSPEATQEELDAAFEWLAVTGVKKDLDEVAVENLKKGFEATLAKNGLVLPKTAIPVWVNEDRLSKDLAVREEYANVKEEAFANYFDTTGVTIKPEEPALCQELYAVLDKCIQEVITNENADCKALIETANNDFQVNHLDKMD